MPAFKLAKVVGVSFLALTLVSVAHREVSAQVLVSGFTNGLFCAGTGCNNPNTASLQTTSILGTGATQPGHRLYYSNSQFSGLTSGNSVAFNNAASGFSFASGNVTTQNVNNFGAFYMGGGPGVTYASPFTLWITLTNPTNTGLVFTGALTGTAVAVNPDTELRSVARARGWAIRDFRTGRKAAKIGVPTVAGAALAGGLVGGAVALRRRDKFPF